MHRPRAFGAGVLLAAGLIGGPAAAGPAAPAAGSMVVTSPADVVDALPGDGRCRTLDGRCTLRAAVMEANASGGGTITLPAGRFTLTIGPSLLDRALQVAPLVGDDRGGDLDVKRAITIRGAGAGRTTIDGNQLHRLFQVQPLARLTISDVTLTGGRMQGTFGGQILQYSGGGAIWNAASLSVERVTITGNEAGYGGGVFNDPLSSATFVDSTISSNTAGEAGGVRCDSTCSFVNTTVRDNTVVDPGDPTRPGSLAGTGGGIDIRGIAPVSIVGSTITGNRADYGGGINAAPGYLDTFPNPPVEQGTQVRLQNTTITGNVARLAGGDCRAQFARFISLGGNTDSDGSCGLDHPSDDPG